MTEQEILEKAIQKAIDGGWKPTQYEFPNLLGANWDEPANQQLLPHVIFNHDFAKALWGNDKRPCDMSITYNVGGPEKIFSPIPSWVLHLMMMVKEDDPINYLGDHI